MKKCFFNRNNFNYLKKGIYFDNNATTLSFNLDKKENVILGHGRSSYSHQNDSSIEKLRNTVLKIFSAKLHKVFFGLNSTDVFHKIIESIQLQGDEKILCSIFNHNSIVLPLIQKKIKVDWIEDEEITVEKLKKIIDCNTKIVILNHCDSVTGRILNNYYNIAKLCFKLGVLLFLDVSQSVWFEPKINQYIDFIFFSAHKYHSVTGVGIGIVSKRLEDILTATHVGGGSVYNIVKKDEKYEILYKDFPYSFETGTQNTIGLNTTLNCFYRLKKIKYEYKNLIPEYLNSLKVYLVEQLILIPDLIFFNDCDKTIKPTVSFYFKNVHSHDIEVELYKRKIFVRSGKFCSNLQLLFFQTNDLVRISLSVYNTFEEIKKFILILRSILKKFKL